jgi:hypothetical protein
MDEQYLVWSNEHQAWWRPNSAGYSTDVRNAGRYSRAEAIEISGTARNGWRKPERLPDELAINIQDLPPEIFAAILTRDPVGTVGGSHGA